MPATEFLLSGDALCAPGGANGRRTPAAESIDATSNPKIGVRKRMFQFSYLIGAIKLNAAPALVIGASSTLAMLQVVPQINGIDFATPVERLSLVAVLIVAIRVLWSTNRELMQQNFKMSADVVKTMTEVLAAVTEQRKTNDELGNAMDEMSSQMAVLILKDNNRHDKTHHSN